MKKILAFDTETTGLINMNLDPASMLQPWPVQIGAILASEDGLKHISLDMLIKSPIPIEEKALATHGITRERAETYGLAQVTAVSMLYSLIARADVIVGHNLDFDIEIIRLAKLRLGIYHAHDLFDGKEHFCTQKKTARYIQLPPTDNMVLAGYGDQPKAPKLAESYSYFLNKQMTGAHDALTDASASLEIYFTIKRIYDE